MSPGLSLLRFSSPILRVQDMHQCVMPSVTTYCPEPQAAMTALPETKQRKGNSGHPFPKRIRRIVHHSLSQSMSPNRPMFLMAASASFRK